MRIFRYLCAGATIKDVNSACSSFQLTHLFIIRTDFLMVSNTSSLKTSSHLGMGAIPYFDTSGKQVGTAFRVWSPFASEIHVSGDFNGWSKKANLLVSEGNG